MQDLGNFAFGLRTKGDTDDEDATPQGNPQPEGKSNEDEPVIENEEKKIEEPPLTLTINHYSQNIENFNNYDNNNNDNNNQIQDFRIPWTVEKEKTFVRYKNELIQVGFGDGNQLFSTNKGIRCKICLDENVACGLIPSNPKIINKWKIKRHLCGIIHFS